LINICIIPKPLGKKSHNLRLLLLVVLFLEVVGVVDEVDKMIDGILTLLTGLAKSFL